MMSSLMIFDHLWPGLSGPMQENEVPAVSVLGGSGPRCGRKGFKGECTETFTETSESSDFVKSCTVEC